MRSEMVKGKIPRNHIQYSCASHSADCLGWDSTTSTSRVPNASSVIHLLVCIFSLRYGVRVDPVLVIHGGAWAIPDDVVEDHRRGVLNALRTGWKILASGGSALQAVEEAVVVM